MLQIVLVLILTVLHSVVMFFRLIVLRLSWNC